jgi:hypothetical protein
MQLGPGRYRAVVESLPAPGSPGGIVVERSAYDAQLRVGTSSLATPIRSRFPPLEARAGHPAYGDVAGRGSESRNDDVASRPAQARSGTRLNIARGTRSPYPDPGTRTPVPGPRYPEPGSFQRLAVLDSWFATGPPGGLGGRV